MDKIKELLEKFKAIFIKLKSINIDASLFKRNKSSSTSYSSDNSSTENNTTYSKKLNLSNLKDLFTIENIKNLKNIDYKDFYVSNKQIILTSLLTVMGVFFLFYWTLEYLNSKIDDNIYAADKTYEKLQKATNMSEQLKVSKSLNFNNMNSGLLTFIQDTGSSVGISNKLVNIRPVSSAKNSEIVSLRLENLYYDELIKFIATIEKYDNLQVKNISFTRRYDNPKMIDSSMEVSKI